MAPASTSCWSSDQSLRYRLEAPSRRGDTSQARVPAAAAFGEGVSSVAITQSLVTTSGCC
jgi:hypothetical protein